MNLIRKINGSGSMVLFVCLISLVLGGCGSITPLENLTYGLIGTTVLGARTPSTEIEQIYYLGVFDPEEQVPPSVYRVRVHGQASALSATKFSSGWVRADLLDSLNTQITYDTKGKISITPSPPDKFETFSTGRRLMLFGPEGFREAPKDHRLVIVMGSSPEDFFRAMDQSLEAVSGAIIDRQNAELVSKLFAALREMQNEQRLLGETTKDIESELPKPKEEN